MTFDTNGNTMMGVTPIQAIDALKKLDLVALGGNCGNGPEEIEGVIQAMYAADQSFPLVAKSNAGIPQFEAGTLRYDGTPEVMAEYAVRVRNYGARIIGACCGSTPTHIAAMRQALTTRPIQRMVINTAAATAAAPRKSYRRRHRRRG